jgi:hypothetical protein
MKKTEIYYCVYNLTNTKMYGMFADYQSAEKWVKKITPVVKEDLKIKESNFTMELPKGIDFAKEKDEFVIDKNKTPMENMTSFVEWSYNELKHNIDTNYEGLVALEIISSIRKMSEFLKDAEDDSMGRIYQKLKESHNQFLEAGKIFGIEFMLNYTYDFWRNQDEKDALVSHYYDKMLKKDANK